MANFTNTSSLKKSARKPTIVVRQTVTSKLRAERGDKLQYFKNELQTLEESVVKKENSVIFDKDLVTLGNRCKVPNSNFSLMNKIKKVDANTVNCTKFKSNNNKRNNIASAADNNKSTIVSSTQSKKETLCLNSKKLLNKNVSTTNTSTINKKDRLSLMPNQIKVTLLNKNTNITNTSNKKEKLPNQIRTTISSKFNSEKLSLKANQIKDTKLLSRNMNSGNSCTNNKKEKSLMSNHIRSTLSSKLHSEIKTTMLKSNSKQKTNTVIHTSQCAIKKESNALKNTDIRQKSALKSANSTSTGVKKCVTLKSPVRKSISAMHFKRVTNCNRNSIIQRTSSWTDGLSPKMEKTPYCSHVKEQPFLFHTPSMNQRRSVAFQTPASIQKFSVSPFSIISSPTTLDLKRRLSLWLEKRGKPLDSFHHLRCFNIHSTTEIDDENKENFEIYIPDKNSSYEDLKIKLENEKSVEILEDSTKNISLANDALYDLHKLISDGYPRDQCEAWLDIICSKYQDIQEKSQYWECRAALEEVRGNFQSALDCYSNAIVKGAKVEKINEPLDNLLEKFSVLNISQPETYKHSEQRTKEILDARNIFKSSFIGFAVHQQKKEERQLTATPVRRSSRRSRSHYVSTPNVTLYTTLQDLDSPIRETLQFRINRALLH